MSLNKRITACSAKTIQTALKRIDNETLSIGMTKMTPKARQVIYAAMSERAAQMIREQVSSLKKQTLSAQTVKNAHDVISGSIQNISPPKQQPDSRTLTQAKATFDAMLKQKPARELSPKDQAKAYKAMATIAHQSGILWLENLLDRMDCPITVFGMKLIIDGTSPRLVYRMMQDRIHNQMQALERNLTMMTKGAVSVACGDNGRIIQVKLECVTPPEILALTEGTYVYPNKVTKASLRAALKGAPLSQRPCQDMIMPWVMIGIYVRQKGLDSIADILAMNDDAILHRLLGMVHKRSGSAVLRKAARVLRRSTLSQEHTRLEITLNALLAIQKGESPAHVRDICLAAT